MGVACPRRHLFALPLWCPEGRRAPGGTGCPCHCGARRGGEPPAALAVPAAAVPEGRRAPGRHLHTLPRGRGPSQTPKFLSPGPPSPWLPALHPVNKQKPLVVQVPRPAKPWGCKGRSPLHKKTKNLPLPAGKGGGGMGAESKLKAAGAGDKQGAPPSGHRQHRNGKKAGKAGVPPLPPADKSTVDS